jgi:hypothetical protein
MSESQSTPTHIISFFKDAGRIGGGSVILAIILLGVTFVEHSKGHNVETFWLGMLVIVFFCFGACVAWDKERKKYERELAKNENPEIECILNKVYAHDIKCVEPLPPHGTRYSQPKTPTTHFILDLTFSNGRNVPTNLSNLELSIDIPGRVFSGKFLECESGISITNEIVPGENRILAEIERTSVDLDITSDNPLNRGVKRPCWAHFIVFNFPPSVNEGIVCLRFKDGTMKESDNPHEISKGTSFIRAKVNYGTNTSIV